MIKSTLIIFVLFLTTTVYAAPSGKDLHDSKCLSCHSTRVYTRSDRKTTSFAMLSQRVKMCARGAAKVSWSDKQVNSVTDYLNSRFYKF